LLQGVSNLPFLFCPNFEKYIDVDKNKKILVIKTVGSKHDVQEIPSTLFELNEQF